MVRKRWISSSETSCFPSVLHLLLVQKEGKERLKGGETAGEETHGSCCGQRKWGREMEKEGNLPQ